MASDGGGDYGVLRAAMTLVEGGCRVRAHELHYGRQDVETTPMVGASVAAGWGRRGGKEDRISWVAAASTKRSGGSKLVGWGCWDLR
jgi:hypothetical protein